MKRFTRFLTIFLIMVLATISIFSINPKAQEPPTGVESTVRTVSNWNHVGTIAGEILLESNAIYISELYKYFLFDLKALSNYSPDSGPFESSNGIYFYSSPSSSATPTNVIRYDDYTFDNFIDMSAYNNRWIKFRFSRVLPAGHTVETYLFHINNSGDYKFSILAISGTGTIIVDELYTYLTEYVDSFLADSIDRSYQEGYYKGKVDYGYNYNGNIIKGISAYDLGYEEGVEYASDLGFTGIISQVFVGLGSFLSIELLPNITFGAIFAVPLVFGIIFFIIGKRGGKDD